MSQGLDWLFGPQDPNAPIPRPSWTELGMQALGQSFPVGSFRYNSTGGRIGATAGRLGVSLADVIGKNMTLQRLDPNAQQTRAFLPVYQQKAQEWQDAMKQGVQQGFVQGLFGAQPMTQEASPGGFKAGPGGSITNEPPRFGLFGPGQAPRAFETRPDLTVGAKPAAPAERPPFFAQNPAAAARARAYGMTPTEMGDFTPGQKAVEQHAQLQLEAEKRKQGIIQNLRKSVESRTDLPEWQKRAALAAAESADIKTLQKIISPNADADLWATAQTGKEFTPEQLQRAQNLDDNDRNALFQVQSRAKRASGAGTPSFERDLDAEAKRLGLEGKAAYDWKNRQRAQHATEVRPPIDTAGRESREESAWKQRIRGDIYVRQREMAQLLAGGAPVLTPEEKAGKTSEQQTLLRQQKQKALKDRYNELDKINRQSQLAIDNGGVMSQGVFDDIVAEVRAGRTARDTPESLQAKARQAAKSRGFRFDPQGNPIQ